LNALRKAEQARQGKQMPNLQSTLLQPTQPTESKRGLLLTLVGCNVALLLLFVVYLWQSSTPEAPVTDSPGATVASAATGQQPPDARASQRKGAESPPTLADQVRPGARPSSTIAEMPKRKKSRQRSGTTVAGIAPLERLGRGTSRPKSTSGGQGRQPQRRQAVIAKRRIEVSQAEDPAELAALLANPVLPPEAAGISRTQPPAATPAPAADPLPLLNELPYSIRRKFPKLKINVYVYSNDPRERFMIVDMVRFQEGQKITDKIVLKEIRPDDFVVSFSGKTFRVPRP